MAALRTVTQVFAPFAKKRDVPPHGQGVSGTLLPQEPAGDCRSSIPSPNWPQKTQRVTKKENECESSLCVFLCFLRQYSGKIAELRFSLLPTAKVIQRCR